MGPFPCLRGTRVGWECPINGCFLRQRCAPCAGGNAVGEKGGLFPEVEEADVGIWVRCAGGRPFQPQGRDRPEARKQEVPGSQDALKRAVVDEAGEKEEAGQSLQPGGNMSSEIRPTRSPVLVLPLVGVFCYPCRRWFSHLPVREQSSFTEDCECSTGSGS